MHTTHPTRPFRSFARAGLLSAAMTLATSAHAAAYLKIEGVKGEVQAGFVAQRFQWQAALAGPAFDPFQPTFAGGVYVASGDVVGDGTGLWSSLELVAVGDDGGAELRYELKDVLVSSYSISGAGGASGGTLHIDSWGRAALHWLPAGASGPSYAMHWDWASRSADGDLEALGAFAALGAERLADGSLLLTSAVPEPPVALLLAAGAAALVLRRRMA